MLDMGFFDLCKTVENCKEQLSEIMTDINRIYRGQFNVQIQIKELVMGPNIKGAESFNERPPKANFKAECEKFPGTTKKLQMFEVWRRKWRPRLALWHLLTDCQGENLSK